MTVFDLFSLKKSLNKTVSMLPKKGIKIKPFSYFAKLKGKSIKYFSKIQCFLVKGENHLNC